MLRLLAHSMGWNPAATPLELDGEEYVFEQWLNPGEYSYQIVEDGAWKLDANNPNKKDNGMGGGE